MSTKPQVIVTGGVGYIGIHTAVHLRVNGFEVVSVDSLERAEPRLLERIRERLGFSITNYRVDLRDREAVREVVHQHRDAIGLIHFAAYKSVPESVREPLLYFDNNVKGLLHTLEAVLEAGIPAFVFSSSCSVYGQPRVLPVDESHPPGMPESPYASSKQVCEQILRDVSRWSGGALRVVSLRYFNPAGAHTSLAVGEVPTSDADNLFPRIALACVGRLPALTVYGSDYNTKDGTPLRDYIHIEDLAQAHLLALHYALHTQDTPYQVINLGSGHGYTVLQVIETYQRVTGVAVPYTIGERRPGDVEAVYAHNERAARLLGWRPTRTLADMCVSGWQWQLQMENDRVLRARLDRHYPVVDTTRYSALKIPA